MFSQSLQRHLLQFCTSSLSLARFGAVRHTFQFDPFSSRSTYELWPSQTQQLINHLQGHQLVGVFLLFQRNAVQRPSQRQNVHFDTLS